MGRPKDEVLWNQVDGTAARWVCKHCRRGFAGSAARIRNHLSGAGNDISGCAFVPSHIRDEALKKNARKRRLSSSTSPLRISSSSTAAALPPQHDPPPSSSNGPDPITKSAAEEYVRNAFMKMLMAIGVSDAVNHPTVWEFCKRAHQHGVPLSLLGNDPFVMGKWLSYTKHEVYHYMSMVKESWKTTGCTLITYNLSEKKENFASGGEGMDVIGFYCPKGFIFVKAPINEANFDVEIFKDALKQHQPSLEVDDIICLIKHHSVPKFTRNDLIPSYLTRFNVEHGFPLCETSECVCIDICPVYKEIGSVESCSCLRRQIQRACMENCGESEWANTLIRTAVRLHKLLVKKNALREWYFRILAKTGEKIPKFLGTEKKFHEVHLSIFLLIMRLAADMQQLSQQKSYLSSKSLKLIGYPKFWIEGRKLALVLTLILRIPDIMDTLVPTSGYLGMALHKVESVLLEVNESSSSGITKADEAFRFWTCLRNMVVELCPNSIWSKLDPRYILQEENVNVPSELRMLRNCLERFVKKEEELPQLRKDVECYRDVFCCFSEKIQLNNFHPVKLWEQYGHDLPLLQKYAIKLLSQPLTCMCNQVRKHIYQLQGGDDYILRLNVRMMEEFKVLGDDIYNPIDINAWEWIPAGLCTFEPNPNFDNDDENFQLEFNYSMKYILWR